jgi:hypothetical protein
MALGHIVWASHVLQDSPQRLIVQRSSRSSCCMMQTVNVPRLLSDTWCDGNPSHGHPRSSRKQCMCYIGCVTRCRRLTSLWALHAGAVAQEPAIRGLETRCDIVGKCNAAEVQPEGANRGVAGLPAVPGMLGCS